MRTVSVTVDLDREDARILARLLGRSQPRTNAEREFVVALLDRVPLDLQPKEQR